MTECEKCQGLLDLYVDHALREEEQIWVDEHLEGCAVCQQALSELKEIKRQLAVWAAEEITPPDGFREALFARLEQEAAPTRKRQKRTVLYRALPWAAAALLLVALLPAMHGLLGAGQESRNDAQTPPMQAAVEPPDEGETAQQQMAAQTAPEPRSLSLSTEPAESAPAEPAPELAGETQKNAVSQQQQPQQTENSAADEAGHAPMLAASEDQGSGAPAPANEEAAPPVMFRSARMPEPEREEDAAETASAQPDWPALKQQSEALQAQYASELEALRAQYDAEPTDQLAQAITDKEAQLTKTAAQLTAIAAEDYEAYQKAQ